MRYDVLRDYGGKDKETRREYNARFGQPTGPDIDIPDAAAHVWEWFWAISGRRGSGMGSPLPISYTEIDAWARRMRIEILPEEIEMLCAMDDAFLSVSADESEAASARANANKPKPKR